MSESRSERMSRATEARNNAIEEIRRFLEGVAHAGREMDPWERNCIGAALGAIYSGLYVLAAVEAHLAATPTDERSPEAKMSDPSLDELTVELARRALDEAAAQPIREIPVFVARQ